MRFYQDREFWLVAMGGVGGYAFAKTESWWSAIVIGVLLGVSYAILDDVLGGNDEGE